MTTTTCTVVTAEEIAAREAAMIPVDATAHAVATREPNGEWKVTATIICDVQTDRGGSYAWGLGPRHAHLAARLVRAINAGAILSDYKMGTDVNGRTYLRATSGILSRTMNADLNRLGY